LWIVQIWPIDAKRKQGLNETVVKMWEEGKTNKEIEIQLNLLADKYKKSRSKYEIENLGNYEKIYPT